MICRCASPAIHAQRAQDADDENRRYSEQQQKKRTQDAEAELRAVTPDPSNFQIVEVHPYERALVLKVRFPSCTRCEYEGIKVLVYLNVTAVDALKWTKLDPHFRRPPKTPDVHAAPSPDARFPASEDGWRDACIYAERRMNAKREGRV